MESLRILFLEKTTIIELTKNTDIFLAGEKNNSEYILISGVVHRCNISDKGDMVTTGFYVSSAVITPHFARTKESKSISGECKINSVWDYFFVTKLQRL